jgi:hypothetical protein
MKLEPKTRQGHADRRRSLTGGLCAQSLSRDSGADGGESAGGRGARGGGRVMHRAVRQGIDGSRERTKGLRRNEQQGERNRQADGAYLDEVADLAGGCGFLVRVVMEKGRGSGRQGQKHQERQDCNGSFGHQFNTTGRECSLDVTHCNTSPGPRQRRLFAVILSSI